MRRSNLVQVVNNVRKQVRYNTATTNKATSTTTTSEDLDGPCQLKPKEILEQLDKYIIGQKDAKMAVSVALRNRWRRHRVPAELKNEITPKNMLMVGPTGVGKTEIARRVAKLTDAPFVKVECTKFTEVGFVGRDVDSIIDDLLRAAINNEKQKIRKKNKQRVYELALEQVASKLVGTTDPIQIKEWVERIRSGECDDTMVEVVIPDKPPQMPTRMQGKNAAFSIELSTLMRGVPNHGNQRKRLPVKEAIKALEEVEMDKLTDNDEVTRKAALSCEQDGIVVIDEIDKVVLPSNSRYRGSSGSSDEGVQQDLLPLIEGTAVTTKVGKVIHTDHILFIASGAFHNAKPSDMIGELQGRLPIRVELQPLTRQDLYRILTEPKTNLLAQQVEMLATENVKLVFTDEAVREMADVAHQANSSVQNIGARRLHSVVERVMEDISFNAPSLAGQTVEITAETVRKSVSDILVAQDLKKHLI